MRCEAAEERETSRVTFAKPSQDDAELPSIDGAGFHVSDDEIALIEQYRQLKESDQGRVSVALVTENEREIVEDFRQLTFTQQLAFSNAMYCDAFRNTQERITVAKAEAHRARDQGVNRG